MLAGNNDSEFEMEIVKNSQWMEMVLDFNDTMMSTDNSSLKTMNASAENISTRYSNVAFGFVLIALALLILWTIFGNIMVWCALYRVNHLKTLSNYLIGNLALCDFLLAATVLPMSAGYDLLGWWCFGEKMCHLWLSIDVLCCTASIWSLLIISVDRLTATIYPIWYRDQHKKKRAALYIALVWVFSVLVSVPPFFGWGNTISKAYRPENGTEKPQCILFETQSYVVYSAAGSFWIPLLAMGFIYARIFLEIRKRMSIRTVKKSQSYRKHSSTTSTGTPEDSEVVEMEGVSIQVDCESTMYTQAELGSSDASSSYESTCAASMADTDQYSNHQMSPILKPGSKIAISPQHINGYSNSLSPKMACKPHVTYSPSLTTKNGSNTIPNSNLLQVSGQLGNSSLSINSNDSNNDTSRELKPLKPGRHVSIDENVNIKSCPYKKNNNKTKGRKRGSSTIFHDKAEHAKRKMEEKARRRFDRREERATKIMATIMACFLVCWLPFFIMYMTRSFCGADTCKIHPDLLTFIIWLGYANSGLNPILYTIFNEDFRNAFRQLLCPSLRTKRRR